MFYPESRDIYRYIWDGLQSLRGLNPYLTVPGNWGIAGLDPHFIFFQTPYPPVAQLLFVIPALLYKYVGLDWAKVFLALPVFGIGLLLWRRVEGKWWLYFWLNPLIWIHLIRDAHIDGWATLIAITAGGLLFKSKNVLSGSMLALCVLVKPYTIVWLPLFVKKGGLRTLIAFGVVLASLYLPYHYSLDRYVAFVDLMQQWQPGLVAPSVGVLIMGGVTAVLLTRKVSWGSLTVAGLVGLLVAPVIYPWYGLWLWPVALLSKNKWLVGITTAILIFISPRA